MKSGQDIQMHVVESSLPSPFALPEQKQRQPPVQREKYLMELIREGRCEQMEKELESFWQGEGGLVAGRLSLDPLRQAQYLAVGMITMATRAAVDGGVRQSEAFSASDAAIQRLDKMTQPGPVLALMLEFSLQMARSAHDSKTRPSHPAVRSMQHYISTHLYEKITLRQLGESCGLAPDHAAKVFRTAVGQTPMQYARAAKLEEAKRLLSLKSGTPQQVADSLCFCNHSHFIQCFERYVGCTPARFCARYGALEE